MGNCGSSDTSLAPDLEMQLFASLRDEQMVRAQDLLDASADINFRYAAWEDKELTRPIQCLPCLSVAEIKEKVWFAGVVHTKRWFGSEYEVEAEGEMWRACNAGSSPKVQDGGTLMHIALKLGRSDVVQFLLRQPGFDYTVTNKDGQTAAEVAIQHSAEHLLSSQPAIMKAEAARQQTAVAEKDGADETAVDAVTVQAVGSGEDSGDISATAVDGGEGEAAAGGAGAEAGQGVGVASSGVTLEAGGEVSSS